MNAWSPGNEKIALALSNGSDPATWSLQAEDIITFSLLIRMLRDQGIEHTLEGSILRFAVKSEKP